LVELYKKSLNESNNNKRSYEAHFNINNKRSYEVHFNDTTMEASTSRTIHSNTEMPKVTDTDDMDMENTIVEYHSNDVFGDLK
jgi:hypothetical protein